MFLFIKLILPWIALVYNVSQNQFLSGVLLLWIDFLASHRQVCSAKIKESSLANYTHKDRGRKEEIMPYSCVFNDFQEGYNLFL